MINSVTLHRLPDGLPVPVFNLSPSLDAASWTWGFDAQPPARRKASVAPGDASARSNWWPASTARQFRVMAENISRERIFGDASIRISGTRAQRRAGCALCAGDEPSSSRGAHARQLMDVLTLNGIPLGWTSIGASRTGTFRPGCSPAGHVDRSAGSSPVRSAAT